MIKAIIGELKLWVLHNIRWIQHKVERRYIGLVFIIWIILIPIVFKIILVILIIAIVIAVKGRALVKAICCIIRVLEVILAGHHHLLLSLILYHLGLSLVRRWIIIEDCIAAALLTQSCNRSMNLRNVGRGSIGIELLKLLLMLHVLNVLLLLSWNHLLLALIIEIKIVILEILVMPYQRRWNHVASFSHLVVLL